MLFTTQVLLQRTIKDSPLSRFIYLENKIRYLTRKGPRVFPFNSIGYRICCKVSKTRRRVFLPLSDPKIYYKISRFCRFSFRTQIYKKGLKYCNDRELK